MSRLRFVVVGLPTPPDSVLFPPSRSLIAQIHFIQGDLIQLFD
jgi:hypothetical protein